MPTYSLPTDRWPKSETLHGWLQGLSAGAICSVLSIAYSLSYATLIFSGSLSEWLGYGMALTLLSASIGALVIGLRSSVPFAIAGPDSSTSAVLAALVAKFAHSLLVGGKTENLLQDAILILSLATALTGAVLLVLGITRAGRAIRFVPYPVIGGFLGATGWLIVVGGAQVTTGHRVTIDTAAVLLDSIMGAKLLAGVATATVLFLGRRWVRSSFALPGLLLACVAAVHLTLRSFGISVAEGQSSGWFFMPQSVVALASPWHGDELRRFPWETLPSLTGDLLSVIFVTTITMLLNTTGVELATQRDADLDRELKSHGLANLLAATFGGCISVTSVSRTTVNYLAGTTNRLPAVTVPQILAAMIWADPSFLGYVPKC